MYDDDGYPNWDLVMVDFYCSEGEIDGKEYGLTKKTSETRWEEFLRKKGVKVDVVNLNVTVDTFEELSKQGEIVVAISPLRMRNANGELVDTRDGGHAMVITGVVTIKGKKMYKVSSWGEAYYIDTDDFKGKMRIEYQQSRYESFLVLIECFIVFLTSCNNDLKKDVSDVNSISNIYEIEPSLAAKLYPIGYDFEMACQKGLTDSSIYEKKYLLLQSCYRTVFNYYLDEKVGISKYQDSIDKSEYTFPVCKHSEFAKFSSFGRKNIFIRNYTSQINI